MTDKPEYNKVDKFLHKHIDPHFWSILSVLLIVFVLLTVNMASDRTSGITDDNDIAQRLGDTGWVLFTTSQCTYCDAQKNILGLTEGLTVVECDSNEIDAYACAANNVSIVPTWLNVESGEVVEGLQTIEQLELMI